MSLYGTDFTLEKNEGGFGNTLPFTPLEKSLTACVDWFSCTFHNVQFPEEVAQLLQIPFSEFEILENGKGAYQQGARLGHITISWDAVESAGDLGIWLEMTGQGCREYENRFCENLNWSEFFALLLNFNVNFARLDLAIDDFKGYFTLRQLHGKIKRGEVASRFRKYRNYENGRLSDGQVEGQTIYIGTKDIEFRFYDKKMERIQKGYEILESIDLWNRYEIQLRHERAQTVCKMLAFDSISIGDFTMGLFKEFIDVKVKNPNEKKKYRWKTVKWWSDFLKDVQQVKLDQVAVEHNILKTQNWLKNSTSRSLARIYKAYDYNDHVIESLLNYGMRKMNKDDDYMINEFKKKKEQKNIFIDDEYRQLMQYSSDVVYQREILENSSLHKKTRN